MRSVAVAVATNVGTSVQVNKGGAEGTRTPDPHTASVVRYQLRHSPMVRRVMVHGRTGRPWMGGLADVRSGGRDDVDGRAGGASAGAAARAGRPAHRGGRGAGAPAAGRRSERQRRRDPRRPGPAADHGQAGPLGGVPVRPARGAPRADRRRARLQRHRWAADAGRLHPRRPRAVGGDVRPRAGGRRRDRAVDDPERLRLRAVHRWDRHPPGWHRARRDRAAAVRRHDPAADHPAARPAAGHPHLHAVVRGLPRRGDPGRRHRGGRAVADGRDLRRRAVERVAAPSDRGAAADQGPRHLRAVRGHRSRRRQRVPARRRTGCTSTRTTSWSRRSTRRPASRRRTARPAT